MVVRSRSEDTADSASATNATSFTIGSSLAAGLSTMSPGTMSPDPAFRENPTKPSLSINHHPMDPDDAEMARASSSGPGGLPSDEPAGTKTGGSITRRRSPGWSATRREPSADSKYNSV